MLLAPLSEYWGRRPVYIVSWAIFTIFQLPVSPDRRDCDFFDWLMKVTVARPGTKCRDGTDLSIHTGICRLVSEITAA
jgi:hypothetical protein